MFYGILRLFTNKVDFIKKIAREVLFESDGIVTNLHFKDIDDWGAWLYEENDIRYWRIFDNKSQQIGDLSKSGELRFDLNHKGFWETVNKKFEFSEAGVKKATRYIWLKNQRPAEGIKHIEESGVSGYGRKGKKTVFKNIGNFFTQESLLPSGKLFQINIFTPENERVGQLMSKGDLWYVSEVQSKSSDSLWDRADGNYKDNIERAVRYVFLKTQKPVEDKLQLPEGIMSNKYLVFKNIEGWSAKKTIDVIGNYWKIYDSDGYEVGELDSDGGLYFLVAKWRSSVSDTDWITSNRIFSVDKAGIEKAVRYVFLKRQQIKKQEQLKEINLTGRNIAMSGQVFKRLKFEDIDGWGAVLLEEDGYIYWTIFNKEGQDVGELYKNNELRYEDSDDFEWTVANVKFAFDETGAKKATRYIFLKTQRPIIAEQIPNITEATYGSKFPFQD